MENAKPFLGTATVLSNEGMMPGVFRLRLLCPEIAASAKPGQFVMVKCGDETLLRRPISISTPAVLRTDKPPYRQYW